MNNENPAHKARIKCTDTLGNVSYVHYAGGWRCTLANGIPAAMSYAGIPDNQEMACKFALNECQHPDQVLETIKRLGPKSYRYELEGAQPRPLYERLRQAAQEARDAGYAVVVFNPEELAGVSPDEMEKRLVMEGNSMLEGEN